MTVRATVKSIQDIMRQDAGVDGDAQRISQLCWMFFLKIFDDQDQQLELMDGAYASPMPEPPLIPPNALFTPVPRPPICPRAVSDTSSAICASRGTSRKICAST